MLTTYRRRRGALSVSRKTAAMARRLASSAAKRIKREAQRPKSVTSLERKLGMLKIGAGKKTYSKKAPRALIKTSDKLEEDIGTGGQEITTISRVVRFKGCGKRPRTTKYEKANITSQVFRYEALSPFMNTTVQPLVTHTGVTGGGANWLWNWTAGNSNMFAPLHLYDLTCINNSTNGTVQSPQVSWELKFNKVDIPSNGLTFTPLYSQSNNGVALTAGNWIAENTSQTTAFINNYPGKSAMQNWVQVNMLCYGAAKQATKFKVALLQINHDEIHPQGIALQSNLNTTFPDPVSELAVNNYEGLIAPYVKHPCSTFFYNKESKDRKIKILKELDFIQQPRLTTETDANVGHCKQVKLFIPLNRINRYDWAQYNQDAGSVTTAASFLANQGANNTNLHPRARIYLAVMATNTNNVASPAVPTTDLTPSYDIVIRTKYSTFTS